ncbi:MAG: methyltransferase domain-containing protein, partial [Desulfurivibrionaceae bacterium]
RLLNKRYPAARITAIDFAETMLTQAREKLAGEAKVTFHCADAELFLRETEQHYDLVTSNSTMHWFDSFESSATRISQRLTDHGALTCSIFGPETMRELRTGLGKIHGRQVMAPSSFFLGKEELRKILTGLFGTVE